MRSFNDIYATACLHKGGADNVERQLPSFLNSDALCAKPDAHFLSTMSLRVFRSGLKHSMVDAKWPEFERVFNGFDAMFCAHMSDDFIEHCMSDKSLIRHFAKLKTIRQNATYILNKREKYTSFGAFLADWPVEDIVNLWAELKREGGHLGGASGPLFLRMSGKDTFLLSNDVVAVLIAEGVITKAPTSKRDLSSVQNAFNAWQEESGRPMCEISRIISFNAA